MLHNSLEFINAGISFCKYSSKLLRDSSRKLIVAVSFDEAKQLDNFNNERATFLGRLYSC